MEATLTPQEMDTIAKIVSDKLYGKIMAESISNELENKCKIYTKQVIEFYLSDRVISNDVRKVIAPIFEEHLKETKMIEEKLSLYFNTENFKKLELSQLKSRVRQLEEELWNNED